MKFTFAALTLLSFSLHSFATDKLAQKLNGTWKVTSIGCTNNRQIDGQTLKELTSFLKKEMSYKVKISGNVLTKSVNDECSSTVDEFEITKDVVDVSASGLTGIKAIHRKTLKDEMKGGCQQQMMIAEKDLVLVNSSTASKLEISDPQLDLLSGYCLRDSDTVVASEGTLLLKR